MERRNSLHGIDLYNSHHKNRNPKPNHYTSKGLLRAPPLSLLHSAAFSLPPPQQPPLLPLPRRASSFPAKTATGNRRKSTKSSTSRKEEKETHPKISRDTAAAARNIARAGRFDSSVRDVVKDRVDMLLDSVMFAISPPPPSSLPLPSFSLRTKLSCNAVAAGVDAGATDDLRRLLRLQ
ncbi:hypothetical protein AAHA92_03847 [Salvia divinorum]|uniref:Uncharacterized protein n=1 Tax=Salvia divinorum TaxID=28513 RepID=A0ABD1HX97_SALDI